MHDLFASISSTLHGAYGAPVWATAADQAGASQLWTRLVLMVQIMAAPFAECLVLVGIHSYLGIHVLKRRVIFVDLSLAQIAALGTTVGILFGIHDTDSWASFIFSLSFTFMGAAVFALSRLRDDRIPQEAVIGLVYAVTAALAVLVVERTQGVEHLVNIMHGRLLWVKWSEVFTAAGAYVVVGVIHAVLGKRFLQISEDPESAYEQGVDVRLWDFFFYLTFGLVISFSVKVAGVLLVFVFLVAPAILAFMITDRFRTQLVLGWTTGTVVTVVGLGLSWWLDLPSGPTVVSFYGVVLVLAACVVYLVRAESRSRALLGLGVGTATVAAVTGMVVLGGNFLAGTSLAGEGHGHHHHAPPATEPHGDVTAPAPGDARFEPADEHIGHGHALHGHHQDPAEPEVDVSSEASAEAVIGLLPHRYLTAETPFDRLELLREAAEQDRMVALSLLHLFLADGETPPFCRTGAVELVSSLAGRDFGLDPDLSPVENLEALDAFHVWLTEEGG